MKKNGEVEDIQNEAFVLLKAISVLRRFFDDEFGDEWASGLRSSVRAHEKQAIGRSQISLRKLAQARLDITKKAERAGGLVRLEVERLLAAPSDPKQMARIRSETSTDQRQVQTDHIEALGRDRPEDMDYGDLEPVDDEGFPIPRAATRAKAVGVTEKAFERLSEARALVLVAIDELTAAVRRRDQGWPGGHREVDRCEHELDVARAALFQIEADYYKSIKSRDKLKNPKIRGLDRIYKSLSKSNVTEKDYTSRRRVGEIVLDLAKNLDLAITNGFDHVPTTLELETLDYDDTIVVVSIGYLDQSSSNIEIKFTKLPFSLREESSVLDRFVLTEEEIDALYDFKAKAAFEAAKKRPGAVFDHFPEAKDYEERSISHHEEDRVNGRRNPRRNSDDEIRKLERLLRESPNDEALKLKLEMARRRVTGKATGITKEEASALRHGQVIYNVRLRNADGSPLRARVSGAIKTWKRSPEKFSRPIKHGMYDSGYLTNDNASDWRLTEKEAADT